MSRDEWKWLAQLVEIILSVSTALIVGALMYPRDPWFGLFMGALWAVVYTLVGALIGVSAGSVVTPIGLILVLGEAALRALAWTMPDHGARVWTWRISRRLIREGKRRGFRCYEVNRPSPSEAILCFTGGPSGIQEAQIVLSVQTDPEKAPDARWKTSVLPLFGGSIIVDEVSGDPNVKLDEYIQSTFQRVITTPILRGDEE